MMNKNMVLLLALVGLSACVTINIYFPAAAAEKAADKIIEEVWQLKDKETKPSQPGTEAAPEGVSKDKPAETPAK